MTTVARGEELIEAMRAIGPLAVAYSGGVDSALVLAAAVRAVGASRVLALTAISESYPAGELEPAQAFAAGLGVRHLTPRTHELERAGYRANGTDRCYFCKSEVLDVLAEAARLHDIAALATGTNADDALDPFRPGLRAGDERLIRTPLRQLGFGKAEVRTISAEWGLSTFDKPASPCLASRIKHGVEVTGFRLGRIDRAETAVRRVLAQAGIRPRDLRVRDLGDDPRLEVDAFALAAVETVRSAVADAIKAAGFAGEFELTEFRSGALSRAAIDAH
jgi:uncharacterized protein